MEEELRQEAQHGAVDALRRLLNSGVDINAANEGGFTALHLASMSGNLEMVRLLLQNGANINASERFGHTALHRVSMNQSQLYEIVRIARLLIENGANFNATTRSGWSALLVALNNGKDGIVNLLLKKEVNVHASTEHGVTALLMASRSGKVKLVHHLLKRGANVNASSKPDGETPLHAASKNGKVKCVRLLWAYGADIDAVEGVRRMTALDMTERFQQLYGIASDRTKTIGELKRFKRLQLAQVTSLKNAAKIEIMKHMMKMREKRLGDLEGWKNGIKQLVAQSQIPKGLESFLVNEDDLEPES